MEPAYYVQTKNILNPYHNINGLIYGRALYIESGIVDYTLAIKPIYLKGELSGFTINEGNPIPQHVLLEAYQNRNEPDNDSLQILKRSLGAARYLQEGIIRRIVNSITKGIKIDEYIFHFDSSIIHEFFQPVWNGLKIRRTDQPHTEHRMVGTKFMILLESMNRSTYSQSPMYTPTMSPRNLESHQSNGPSPSKEYSMWNGPDILEDARYPLDDIDKQRMVYNLVDEVSRGGKRKSKRRRSSKKSNTKKVKRKSHKKK
jgi:hypothetical protein